MGSPVRGRVGEDRGVVGYSFSFSAEAIIG
jgi:hypothetical protein